MTLKVRDVTCGPYPVEHLVGHQTALIVFAAAFGGLNDGAWIHDAGLTATCVDNDRDALDAMWLHYPDTWEFVCADAYEFAALTERQWDVVSLDPFTNEFDRCAENIAAFCRLARHVVIVGTGACTNLEAPPFWRTAARMYRTGYEGGVYWTVLERA